MKVLLLVCILLLIDWYFYQAVDTVFKKASAIKRKTIFSIYVIITIISVVSILSALVATIENWPKFLQVYLFGIITVIVFSKIVACIFLLIDDSMRFFKWMNKYRTKQAAKSLQLKEGTKISRSKFLNTIALGMAAIPFTGFIYGMVKGAFDYTVHRTKVVLPNLPKDFNGLKIVQISDIHSGSFISTVHLEEAVKVVLNQKPDIIFFTGDLVNQRSNEMLPFMNVLNKLTAPLGIYSILGNHDYGSNVKWENDEAKQQNFTEMQNIHATLGWRLLRNEHVPLKRGAASIALIGVENWGAKLKYPRYGDLKKATAGTENYPVKLLLTHDPSHWDAQVRPEHPDIDITFSGHTHGFQMGVEAGGVKWSPAQYIYKEWAGLYSDGRQYIYVNRGLGFIGYPGRLGIPPEITVIELYNA